MVLLSSLAAHKATNWLLLFILICILGFVKLRMQISILNSVRQIHSLIDALFFNLKIIYTIFGKGMAE
jgi:hypothetical protein